MKRRNALCALASAGGLFAIPAAFAQNTSRSMLTLLVGFGAGSVPDLVARVIGRPMSETLGRTLLVDNRAGVAGQLALVALKQAPADGSAIAITPLAALTLYPSTYAKLPYDPVTDFTPICTVGVTDFAFVVSANHPARTLQEFVIWSRANPGKGSIGNPGTGSSPHFVAWAFAAAAGLDTEHVPYRLPTQISQELVGGTVAAGIASSSLFGELVKAGRLRVLATSGPQRGVMYPEVPTFAEAGYPTVIGQEWYTLFTHSGAALGQIASISAAAQGLRAREEVHKAMLDLGLALDIRDANWITKRMAEETARWREVATRAGFKAL
ncbi:tripartite tricarboxylate transporter substrate-binding protein [Variovorax ureilyticus]|uniref:Tripartite tricarboxylate transporter substrate-binding protein n=1 Tax=Variovorax ureilyticus TaxID=1836198 RepID=A0ABU8VRZ7_9BURK